MCVAKHSFTCCKDNAVPFQALFCEHYRGVHLCEIYIKPRLFMRVLLIFKGAHEIVSLSWFFCVMAKEQEIESITYH